MQVLVPVSTTAAGDWTGYPSGDPHAAIDETTRDDNDRAQTDLYPSGDQPLIVKLTTPTQPIRAGAKVKYTVGTTRDPKHVWVRLYCGNVQIAEWVHASITTLGEFEQTLNAGHAAAIAACVDPTDLYLHFMGGSGVIHNVGTSEKLELRDLTAYESDADFLYRSTRPGVVRALKFGSAMLPAWDPPPANYDQPTGWVGGTAADPVIDTYVKLWGGGSLRFDVPSQSDQAGSGLFYLQFADDYSVQFGANTSFFIQWRQRFNQAFIDTVFSAGGGIKQVNIVDGNLADGDGLGSACSPIEVVCTSYGNRRLSIMYNTCPGDDAVFWHNGEMPYEDDSGEWRLQNFGGVGPYCMWSTNQPSGTGVAVGANCIPWVADEWMTFQIQIKKGARGTWLDGMRGVYGPFPNGCWLDSEVRLWIAREGQPSVLAHAWVPSVSNYEPLGAGVPADDMKHGKLWLSVYQHGKDANQVHDLCQTWFDEIIIRSGTERIPDPGVTVFPSWRTGKTVDVLFQIDGTQNMSGYEWQNLSGVANGSPDYVINVWNGFARRDNEWWGILNGGDGVWQNAVQKIDLSADAPAWVEVHPGTQGPNNNEIPPDVQNADYYADGLPAARHTYWSTQYIPPGATPDGLERIMCFTAMAVYYNRSSRMVTGFKIAAETYDASGTWQDEQTWDTGSTSPASFCKHPTTHVIYALTTGDEVEVWTPGSAGPSAGWSSFATTPTYPDPDHLPACVYYPSMVDLQRNRIVVLYGGYGSWNPLLDPQQEYPLGLWFIDLTTHAVTHTDLTGASLPGGVRNGSKIIHDLDNDRYLVLASHTQPTPNSWSDASDTWLYAIDPEDCTTTVLMANAPLAFGGIWNKFEYFPDLGGAAYCPSYAGGIWFLPTR